MRSITTSRVLLSGALALGALGAGAAFDVGSSTAEAAPSVSPFAGSWSGMWSVVDSVDPRIAFFGTFDWTFSDSGRLTGTGYNITAGHGGTIVGHVDADGSLRFVREAPLSEPALGLSGVPCYGTAVIGDDGRLVVSAAGTDSTRLLFAILESN